MLPDSGAAADLLSLKAAQRWGLTIKTEDLPKITLRDASGNSMPIQGTAEVLIEDTEGEWVLVRALISDRVKQDFLLSWHSQKNIGMLPNSWPYYYCKKIKKPHQPEAGGV